MKQFRTEFPYYVSFYSTPEKLGQDVLICDSYTQETIAIVPESILSKRLYQDAIGINDSSAMQDIMYDWILERQDLYYLRAS